MSLVRGGVLLSDSFINGGQVGRPLILRSTRHNRALQMQPKATKTHSGIGFRCHGPLLEIWARRQPFLRLEAANETETKTWQTSTDPGAEVWDSALASVLIDPTGRSRLGPRRNQIRSASKALLDGRQE